MTPDEQLIALRRQVRELQEEIAEYRRRGDRSEAAPDANRQWAARQHFRTRGKGAQGLAVRAILVLADRSPNIVHPARFRDLALKDPDDVGDRYVHVVICHARAALRPHGLKIETIWGGAGYRMSAPDAAAVKRLIGEGGDD